MIVVVIVIYSIARTKLLNYSSLAYFPLTFLAAWVWDKWVDRKTEIGTWQVILILIDCPLLFGPGHSLFPYWPVIPIGFQEVNCHLSTSLPGPPFKGMCTGADPNGWWEFSCSWV